MLVPEDVHTVQRDHGLATVHVNHGLIGVHADGIFRQHVAERMAGDREVMLAGDEVLDAEVRGALLVHDEVGDLGAAVAGAAAGAVMARRRTALVSRAAGSSAGASRTDQSDMAADDHFLGRLAGRLNDFQFATGDCGLAKRTAYGGAALLDNGVVPDTADVDRVVAGDAMLGDRAPMADSERVVAAAHEDGAVTGDVDLVVTVAGDHGPPAINSDIRLPASRNTD